MTRLHLTALSPHKASMHITIPKDCVTSSSLSSVLLDDAMTVHLLLSLKGYNTVYVVRGATEQVHACCKTMFFGR